jgi:hypothetical protein
MVRLQGPASAASAAQVQVEAGSGAGFVAAQFDGSRWSYDWLPQNGADGESYTITATITDAAGQSATDVQNRGRGPDPAHRVHPHAELPPRAAAQTSPSRPGATISATQPDAGGGRGARAATAPASASTW